jgi:polysaccharide export outer membrane protein
MKKIFFFLCISSLLLLSSCISKKRIVYLQGSQGFNSVSTNYDPLIQRDDKLAITVSSLEMDATKPFNLTHSGNGTSNYLVDVAGKIDFPVLGTIQVEGFSISELKVLLKEKLSVYIKNPVVNITIQNFKVTVLGDVKSPGIKTFENHRVTLLDVLGSSGDLTPFGKRKNILIVRDYQGIKSFNRVDITKADFVNSPFYYLDQNDIVYVEQRKAKMDSTALPNLPLVVSVISFLTTMVLLLNR